MFADVGDMICSFLKRTSKVTLTPIIKLILMSATWPEEAYTEYILSCTYPYV